MNWSAIGAAALALAVMLGAFGAHGLKGRLDSYSLGVYERAVFYHFIHALGLLVVPVFARLEMIKPGQSSLVCALLLAGVVIFCGSLYLLAVLGARWLGAITPIGGLSFIAAWAVLAVALVRR
ncbi:MAG: DUF423 domain-containing protein [Acidobacteriota bacterium]